MATNLSRLAEDIAKVAESLPDAAKQGVLAHLRCGPHSVAHAAAYLLGEVILHRVPVRAFLDRKHGN